MRRCLILLSLCVSTSLPVYSQSDLQPKPVTPSVSGDTPVSNSQSPSHPPSTDLTPLPAETKKATSATPSVIAAALAAGAVPNDAKAAKTFAEARQLVKSRNYTFAVDGFRKADKQDGGQCIPCEVQAYKAASQGHNYKAAREEAQLLLEHVTSPTDKFQAHYMAASMCLGEGVQESHEKSFEQADAEFKAALEISPNNQHCLYGDAVTLAHLKQDGSARERFQAYLKVAPTTDVNYSRAQRFADHPEMARARVAPNFRISSLDGKSLTMEDLQGKVVLIDFWATWCGPCRQALPHVREISKKFQGQPLVVLSVSLDKDDAKWKDFVAHNEMTWTQYRDTGGDDSMAKQFGVHEIPATFTIDADGVLQDQHVGDADIDGKIKKLVARANELASRKTVTTARAE